MVELVEERVAQGTVGGNVIASLYASERSERRRGREEDLVESVNHCICMQKARSCAGNQSNTLRRGTTVLAARWRRVRFRTI